MDDHKTYITKFISKTAQNMVVIVVKGILPLAFASSVARIGMFHNIFLVLGQSLHPHLT